MYVFCEQKANVKDGHACIILRGFSPVAYVEDGASQTACLLGRQTGKLHAE